VLASSRLGPLLRSKKFLELFLLVFGKPPGKGLAGNNATSTLWDAFEINWVFSTTSSALFKSRSMPALPTGPLRLLGLPDPEPVV
jgi:hypothetical protein